MNNMISDLRETFVRHAGSERPYATFSRIALDYGVSVTTVSRAWDDLETERKNPKGTPALVSRAVEWKDASPVGDVVAQPGALAVMPMNAVLIQGRIEMQFTQSEMAWAVGMRSADYKALEEGRLLPTEVQAARLSALINIPIRNLFVAAAVETFGSARMKGLSILQLLRCRERLTVKELCRVCVPARQTFVSAIERNMVKYPLSPADVIGLDKLAEFFGVPKETLLGQVPPEVIGRAAQNTAALHDAIHAAAVSLPQLGILSPRAITDGGKKE